MKSNTNECELTCLVLMDITDYPQPVGRVVNCGSLDIPGDSEDLVEH